MPGFRVNGATGQAPTTVFMGPIPDRGFTMLRPQHYVSSGNFTQIDSLGPANYINLWTPYNLFVDTGAGTNAATVSVGATTTAPDGTSSGNASHITEVANTGYHAMIAGTPLNNLRTGGFSVRLAAIAKALERTRIALTITTEATNGNAGFGNVGNGSQTIFDLAGGKIGVVNTAFNFAAVANAIAGLASISPLGSGWYLCMMDTIFPLGQNINTPAGVWGSFNIDAGAGTGGANISYAGDGSSGVYAWRSSMLPPAAWAMSGTKIFNDDFNSISTIDVNNTLAPGYKWYTNNIFPAAGWRVADGNFVTPSSDISVSSSVLSLAQTTAKFLQASLLTAASAGGGGSTNEGVVGRGFIPPFLFEARAKIDPNASLSLSPGSPYLHWFLSLVQLGTGIAGSLPGTGAPPNDPGGFFLPGVEFDMANLNSPGVLGGTLWTWNQGNSPAVPYIDPVYGGYAGSIGYVTWDPTVDYFNNTNDVVYYNGNFYYALNILPTTNTNNQPDISPTFWTKISPQPVTNIDSYATINFGNMNVFNTLILPTPFNDVGWVLQWFNGAPTGGVPRGTGAGSANSMGYAPADSVGQGPNTSYVSRWTIDPLVLILFAGSNHAGGGLPAQYDYISITQ